MTIIANAAQRVICAALLAFALATCRADEGEEDPEVSLCKLQCRRQLQFDERDKEYCVRACAEYGELKKEIERRSKREPAPVEPPEKKLRQCKHECRTVQQSADQRRRCERRCEEKYEEERKRAPPETRRRHQKDAVEKPARRWKRRSRKQWVEEEQRL